jgi:hypothetical protein
MKNRFSTEEVLAGDIRRAQGACLSNQILHLSRSSRNPLRCRQETSWQAQKPQSTSRSAWIQNLDRTGRDKVRPYESMVVSSVGSHGPAAGRCWGMGATVPAPLQSGPLLPIPSY